MRKEQFLWVVEYRCEEYPEWTAHEELCSAARHLALEHEKSIQGLPWAEETRVVKYVPEKKQAAS